MNIFDYVIIGQYPPSPLVNKLNHWKPPSLLLDYVRCERPLIREMFNLLANSWILQLKKCQ